MHPAASVIGFTVASGAGYGMLAIVGLLAMTGMLPTDWRIGLVVMLIAVSLITGGLLSSTFHLGHPERAWRAFSQWRSSWLSREGIAAVVTYGPIALVGWLWLIDGETGSELFRAAGAALLVMCFVTVFSTAMIYRSLPPIPAWHNGFTVPAYLLLGGASGLTFVAAILAVFGAVSMIVLSTALVAVLGAMIVKIIYWNTLKGGGFKLPSRESATGLTLAGAVRPLEDPHSSDNYLMKEMGFRVARKHAEKLRRIALIAGFVLPAVLIVVAMLLPVTGAAALVLASVIMAPGIIAERWLFFAEARHAVTQYYRDRAA